MRADRARKVVITAAARTAERYRTEAAVQRAKSSGSEGTAARKRADALEAEARNITEAIAVLTRSAGR